MLGDAERAGFAGRAAVGRAGFFAGRAGFVTCWETGFAGMRLEALFASQTLRAGYGDVKGASPKEKKILGALRWQTKSQSVTLSQKQNFTLSIRQTMALP